MNKMSDSLIHPKLSYITCGIGFDVHNQLGRFKSEQQYTDAYEQALKDKNVGYVREGFLDTSFKGEKKETNPIF